MIFKIVFFILLIDSVIANIVATIGKRWYIHHFRTISRLVPITIAWTLWYFILVLWIGVLTYKLVF